MKTKLPTTTNSHEANTVLATVRLTIENVFRSTKQVAPIIENFKLTVPVYFIVDNRLYKGEYHANGNFYAYKILGSFDCFASKDGKYTGQMSGDNEVCTYWCYVDDLQITLEAE